MSTPVEVMREKYKRPENAMLRKLHADTGMSNRELAAEIGVTTYDIMRAEFGRSIPIPKAIKIARFFGLTVEELWEGATQ